MSRLQALRGAVLLLGLGLLAKPGPVQAQTSCSSLSQTQILSSFADNVGPGAIVPGTIRNEVCSTSNFLITPTGGSADTLANWTSYLAGTAASPFSFTAANLRTPGGVTAGNPTGGLLGAGTINATGIYVNGVPVSGGLTVPNSSIIGGNGTSLTSVAVGSGLSFNGTTLSVGGSLAPNSIAIGAPTGGNLGVGTLNATGIFINGVAVAGGLSVPSSALLGGNGSGFTAVSLGVGLGISGGALSVTTPYNPTLVGITGGTINGATIGASGPSTGAFTSLNVTGALSGTGVTSLFAAPPPIGNTTPNTASFTTLATTQAASLNSAVLGNATGGSLGAGTINATGVFVNGVSVGGGLSVPNSSLIGGNGSSLTTVTVSTGLTFSSGALSVTSPYNASAVAIGGGTINGTTIGASIASSGSFTTVATSGQLSPASVVVGSATGGNEGTGTLNATGIYVNGVAVAGGLSVPNASLVGGNGSSLLGVTLGGGLSFGSQTLSVTNPYVPSSVAITGGTINGAIIGGSTPAAASFTNLTTNGTSSLGTTNMSGKLSTWLNNTTEGLNVGVASVAPSAPSPGAIWMTSSGLFIKPSSNPPVGPLGTVSSIATGLPIVGGTIVGGGTITCPTCATTTTGGALSGIAPISISASGQVSLGAQNGEAGAYWNGSTPVTADTTVLSSGWPWFSGNIQNVTYYTGGTSTPSFIFSVNVNGVPVTGCSNITVNSSTPTLNHVCTGGNGISNAQTLTITTTGVSGTPTSALVHVYYSHSNP